MKASFLNSLIDMMVSEAEAAIKQYGFTPKALPEGTGSYMTLVESKTIVLFQKGGKVVRAEPGDVGDVENDI